MEGGAISRISIDLSVVETANRGEESCLNQDSRSVIACILFLVLVVVPLGILMEFSWTHKPTITVETSDEVNLQESVLVSTEPYSPTQIVTIVNDSTFGDSVWRWFYNSNEDESSFWRHVNIPLRNISEVMVTATFYIEVGPKGVSLYSYGWLFNETIGFSGQELILTSRVSPADLNHHYSPVAERNAIGIKFDGDYRESMSLTGLVIQVTTNTSLYPVSFDFQRTNGMSLFDYPTMLDVQLAQSLSPYLQFEFNNSIWNGFFFPIQANDTVLLVPGNYTLHFNWNRYELNSTVNITEGATCFIWRVRSVRVDFRLTHNVPSHTVFLAYSEDYSLSESPSIILPPDRNYSIDVRGRYSDAFAITELGVNRNVTIWVNPNVIIIGPLAFTPLILTLVIGLLSVICILAVIKMGLRPLNRKLIPFALVVLSYVLPWVQYTRMEQLPGIYPLERRPIGYAISPGISSTTIHRSDSLRFVTYEYDPPIAILAYLLLFVLLIGLILSEYDNPALRADQVFGTSLFLILISEINYVGTYFSAGYYHALSIGVGPFLVLFSIVAWLVLDRDRWSDSQTKR